MTLVLTIPTSKVHLRKQPVSHTQTVYHHRGSELTDPQRSSPKFGLMSGHGNIGAASCLFSWSSQCSSIVGASGKIMSGHRDTGGIATSNASLVAARSTPRCQVVYLDVLDLSRSEATTNRLLQDGLSLRDRIHQHRAKKKHMARDLQVVPSCLRRVRLEHQEAIRRTRRGIFTESRFQPLAGCSELQERAGRRLDPRPCRVAEREQDVVGSELFDSLNVGAVVSPPLRSQSVQLFSSALQSRRKWFCKLLVLGMIRPFDLKVEFLPFESC
jgi:hypothetical protein